MKYEDMANWTIDQLKNEVVRLSEECRLKKNPNQLQNGMNNATRMTASQPINFIQRLTYLLTDTQI